MYYAINADTSFLKTACKYFTHCRWRPALLLNRLCHSPALYINPFLQHTAGMTIVKSGAQRNQQACITEDCAQGQPTSWYNRKLTVHMQGQPTGWYNRRLTVHMQGQPTGWCNRGLTVHRAANRLVQ